MRSFTLFIVAIFFYGIAAGAEPEIFTVYGAVADTGEEGRAIWFEFEGVPMHFVMLRDAITDADATTLQLAHAKADGEAIAVRYYPSSGAVDSTTGKPTYVVAGVVVGGRESPGERGPLIARLASQASPAEQALSMGIALSSVGRDTQAIPFLDRALSLTPLGPLPRSIALRARAVANGHQAKYNTPPGEGRDRLLIAALADYRAWSTLKPDNQGASARVAEMLADLGAYDEAFAQYQVVLRNWPDDTFWTWIMIGMLQRMQGRYGEALAALDSIVTGPKDGMAYHYHRGWTLIGLHRFEEAVAELTEGLRHQDFVGAYGRRACALAKLGRLREALADEEDVLRIFRNAKSEAQFGTTLQVTFDLQRTSIVTDELRRALARDAHGPSDAPCHGFWEDEFLMRPRERSAFLPPTGEGGRGN